ncbi:MAG: aminoglycoside phosphotransferase family protein [Acidimicrobiia bacterium]
MRVPDSIAGLRNTASGRDWLDRLPAVLAACRERWRLTLEGPYPDSHVALVVPATTDRGDRVVLKLQFPHRESETEAAALRAWAGEGAIRLVDHDSAGRALLLERCEPGDPLATEDAATALGVIVGLLPRLWVSAGAGFGSLADEAARWCHNLPEEWETAGRPFERRLLDAAIETLTELAASQGEQVLLHQDLHGDNILAAQREPWLVIDPKPLVGEREFGLSPVIRSYEFGHSRDQVICRLDRLTDELGLDRERSRLWAFGHAIAWGFENGTVLPRHIETARWLLAA